MIDPLVSIIVPVYNAENYIGDCLDSILKQTYTNFELLLVNDGSSDNSHNICEYFAQKDSRIIVINQDNKGVSAARNAGIQVAHGEWLWFIDADDEIYPYSLETLLNKVTQDVEFVMGSYIIIKGKITTTNMSQENKLEYILSPVQAVSLLFNPLNTNYHGFIWSNLFKSIIIEKNNLRFNEHIFYNEDRLFICEYIACLSKSIYYTSIPIYRYFIRDNSAMQRINGTKFKKFETDLDAFVKMQNIIQQFGDRNLKKYVNYLLINSFRINIELVIKYSNHKLLDIKNLYIKISNYKYFDIMYYIFRYQILRLHKKLLQVLGLKKCSF